MAKTFDQKKQDIFSYLDFHSKRKNFQALSESTIHKKFDKSFGKKEVNNILSKLNEDGSVNSNYVSYEIYFPKDNKKDVLNFLKSHSEILLDKIYIFVGILWFIVLFNVPLLLEFLLKDTQNYYDVFFSGFLITLIVILLISNLIHVIWVWIKERKLIIINEKRTLTIVISGFIVLAIIIIFQIYSPQYTSLAGAITSVILWIIGMLINRKN